MNYHAIERTSPKGQEFFGTCWKCGITNLPSSAALERCDGRKQTQEQDLLQAIEGNSS